MLIFNCISSLRFVNVYFVLQEVVIKRGRSRRAEPESDEDEEVLLLYLRHLMSSISFEGDLELFFFLLDSKC